MKRTLGILLILAALAAVLAAAWWIHYRPRPGVAQAPGTVPELLSELPPGAPYLAFVNVSGLRESEFLAKLVALLPPAGADKDYAAFVRDTGFDYARDLDRLAIAIWPASVGDAMAAVAEGRFDRAKMERYALTAGSAARAGSLEFYRMRSERPGRAMALAFLEPNRLLLADFPADKPPFAVGATGGPDADLRSRIARVAGADFYLVGRTDTLPKDLARIGVRPGPLATIAASLRGIALTGQPAGDALSVGLDAECDSKTDAAQLVTILDAFRWLGRAGMADARTRRQMTAAQAALVDEILRKAQLSRENEHVRVSLQLTPQAIAAAPAGKSN